MRVFATLHRSCVARSFSYSYTLPGRFAGWGFHFRERHGRRGRLPSPSRVFALYALPLRFSNAHTRRLSEHLGGHFQGREGRAAAEVHGARSGQRPPLLRHAMSRDELRAQVAMCNSGKNSNGSQFFITFGPAPQLNGYAPLRLLAAALSSFDHRPRAGKHVVFGKVVSGFEVLEQIEAVGVPAGQDGEPARTVLIFDCGLLP